MGEGLDLGVGEHALGEEGDALLDIEETPEHVRGLGVAEQTRGNAAGRKTLLATLPLSDQSRFSALQACALELQECSRKQLSPSTGLTPA
jgi:hypothetical protein